MNLEIGERIANLRKNKKLTQLDLAEQLNLSHQSVSKWERGESYPDVLILPDLSKLLDTTIDYILTGNKYNQILSEHINIEILTPVKLKEVILSAIDRGIELDVDYALRKLLPNDLKEVILLAIDNGFELDIDYAINKLTPGLLAEVIKYAIENGFELDIDYAINKLTPGLLAEVTKYSIDKKIDN